MSWTTGALPRAIAAVAPILMIASVAFAPSLFAAPPPPPPDDPELDALRKAADEEVGAPAPTAPASPAAAGMSLANPEISAVFDGAAIFVPEPPHVTDDVKSGFILRELELSLQSWIDHLARFRGFVSFSEEGVEVEELTILWPGLLGPVNVTAGRFRQTLDPINRWHAHALDQADLPLVHRRFVGDEGLAQTGLRLDTAFESAAGLTHVLAVEITNSENETLLAGELFSAPSFLGHLANHLAFASGYLELGGGALVGYRNRTGPAGELDPQAIEPTAEPDAVVAEDASRAMLYWGDLTLAYDPPGGRDRFNLFLRGAFFYRDLEDAGAGAAHMGAYAYLQAQLDRSWGVGVRGDWVEAGDDQPETFAVVPAVTFRQSEYLYLRLQYQLALPRGEDAEHMVLLQLDAGIGPHYHERY